MAEHTKGRLAFCQDEESPHFGILCFEDGLPFHNEVRTHEETEANAIRLNAAWNAVSALSTQALEVGVIDDLIEALKDIQHMTDPDSAEENYRADDTEGCLDTVFATAKHALAKLETPCPPTPKS